MKNKSILLSLVILLALGTFVGCGSNDSVKASDYREMDGETLAKIINDEDDSYLILDVRSEEEYNAGHVKNAILEPLATLEEKIADYESYKDKNIVTICNTGNKSGKAAKIFADAGFKSVYNAQGVKKFDYGENLVTE